MRPSNSGIATCQAVSSGERPASDFSHASREEVAQMPCTTGTPRASSAGTSHSSQPSGDPALLASAAFEPPLASTVVTRHSTRPSSISSAGTSPLSSARRE